MRTVDLAQQDWTRVISPEERAVFLRHHPDHELLNTVGSPNHVCYLGSPEEAAALAEHFVRSHSQVLAEIYDQRGLANGLQQTLFSPNITARRDRFRRWRPWLALTLWIAGTALALNEARHEFSRVWPMLIAFKCLVLGAVAFGIALHERFRRSADR